MTYAFTYDVPIDPQVYAVMKERIGPDHPRGLIAHIVYRAEAGLRYVDVWESKDDWEAFVEERLHPVVHPMLQERLGFVPPEPAQTMLDVVHVWTVQHS